MEAIHLAGWSCHDRHRNKTPKEKAIAPLPAIAVSFPLPHSYSKRIKDGQTIPSLEKILKI